MAYGLIWIGIPRVNSDFDMVQAPYLGNSHSSSPCAISSLWRPNFTSTPSSIQGSSKTIFSTVSFLNGFEVTWCFTLKKVFRHRRTALVPRWHPARYIRFARGIHYPETFWLFIFWKAGYFRDMHIEHNYSKTKWQAYGAKMSPSYMQWSKYYLIIFRGPAVSRRIIHLLLELFWHERKKK